MRRRATTMLVLAATLSAGCGGRSGAAAAKILARVDGRLAALVVDERGAPNSSLDTRCGEPLAAGESTGVFIVAELFRQAKAGEADLDERIPLADEARPLRLHHLGSVGKVSLRDLAMLVLTDGDAAATNMLIDRLTFEKINRYARALGATGPVLVRGPHPRDVAAWGAIGDADDLLRSPDRQQDVALGAARRRGDLDRPPRSARSAEGRDELVCQ